MGLFSGKKVYASKWEVVSVDSFSNDEIAAVSKAVVNAGEYSKSVCLTLKTGGQIYYSLEDMDGKFSIGESVDFTKCMKVTLKRGDDHCEKIRIID